MYVRKGVERETRPAAMRRSRGIGEAPMSDDVPTVEEVQLSAAVEQWLMEASYHAAFAKSLALAREIVRESYGTGSRRFKPCDPLRIANPSDS